MAHWASGGDSLRYGRHMFDTIGGLLLHALVVHGVVVLLPLMAVVTLLVAFRPGWSQRVAWGVVAADAAIWGLTLVAKQSGEALFARLGETPQITRHSEWGSSLPWTALGLLAAALLVVLLRPRGIPAQRLGQALTAVAAATAGWWVFRTGDSGARAVWEAIVQNTKAP
jgi:hypothetical protein